jgi:hypothetical protein
MNETRLKNAQYTSPKYPRTVSEVWRYVDLSFPLAFVTARSLRSQSRLAGPCGIGLVLKLDSFHLE